MIVRTRALAAALVIASTFACAGDSEGPVAPSEEPVAGTTITITSSGASPKNLLVPPGSQVTFVNHDNRPHDMQSDPHPEHDDCPQLDQVGFLSPGQGRETGNLNTVRVCGFHDHGDAGDARWQGRITIQ